jgi:hypothetical protein
MPSLIEQEMRRKAEERLRAMFAAAAAELTQKEREDRRIPAADPWPSMAPL